MNNDVRYSAYLAHVFCILLLCVELHEKRKDAVFSSQWVMLASAALFGHNVGKLQPGIQGML